MTYTHIVRAKMIREKNGKWKITRIEEKGDKQNEDKNICTVKWRENKLDSKI